MSWHAKGTGRGAFIEAVCSVCRITFTVENLTHLPGIRHCGKTLDSCPGKTYEAYCELRDKKPDKQCPSIDRGVRYI